MYTWLVICDGDTHFAYFAYNGLEQHKRNHCRELFCYCGFLKMRTTTIKTEKNHFFPVHFYFDWHRLQMKKKCVWQWREDEEIRMFLKRSVTTAQNMYTLIVCNFSSIYITFDSFCRQSHMLIWELVSLPFQSTYLSILTHNYVFNAAKKKKKKKNTTTTTTKKKWLKWKDVKQRNVENQQQQQHHWVCVFFNVDDDDDAAEAPIEVSCKNNECIWWN